MSWQTIVGLHLRPLFTWISPAKTACGMMPLRRPCISGAWVRCFNIILSGIHTRIPAGYTMKETGSGSPFRTVVTLGAEVPLQLPISGMLIIPFLKPILYLTPTKTGMFIPAHGPIHSTISAGSPYMNWGMPLAWTTRTAGLTPSWPPMPEISIFPRKMISQGLPPYTGHRMPPITATGTVTNTGTPIPLIRRPPSLPAMLPTIGTVMTMMTPSIPGRSKPGTTVLIRIVTAMM